MPKKCRKYTMKSKDGKKFLLEVSNKLGIDIENLFGAKTRIEVNETETADLFIVDGLALLARQDEALFFTLNFEDIFPSVPKIVVDMGAVPYVCKGADVMSPGIRSIKDDFEQGDLVIVVDERHGKALAVGSALYSSDEMKTIDRGKTIKTLHYVGDKLWDHIKGS
jgi:PUA domain protein